MRKSTRLSSIGLAELREPPQLQVRNFRTRFSLTSYAKRVQELTEEQRSAISRTGLGNLLQVPNHVLNKILLTELMETWSCERKAFVLDSGEVGITLLDVALILGLRVVGDSVVLRDDEPFSELEEDFGATKGKRKVAMASLEDRLDSLGESVSDDFVRTFLFYTIGTFLSSNDGKVDSRYLAFLKKLDSVCEFAWGAAVVEDLVQWLDKRKENNVQYVGGCLLFLQTWSYEHFDIARPNLLGHDLTFPRVCRWDNSKSRPRQRGTSRFKYLHDDQVTWTLQPSSAELQIELIKEALKMVGDNKELQNAESYSTSTSTSVHGEDTELLLSISSKVHREEEIYIEKQVVADTPTKFSTSDEEYREKINLENLIVEDTPPNLIICDEVNREQQMNLENLIVEDTPTSLSISDADEVSREQEFNVGKLVVDDTPPKLSFSGGDFKNKDVMLNEEIVELTRRLGQVMEENGLLRRQKQQLEEQNAELQKERDLLREENRDLRLSISRFVDEMDRHLLDLETNAYE